MEKNRYQIIYLLTFFMIGCNLTGNKENKNSTIPSPGIYKPTSPEQDSTVRNDMITLYKNGTIKSELFVRGCIQCESIGKWIVEKEIFFASENQIHCVSTPCLKDWEAFKDSPDVKYPIKNITDISFEVLINLFPDSTVWKKYEMGH